MRFGLALHVGEVLYGNIGGGNRLDFTGIGPAVNLAARLEKLARDLGRAIIASGAFAQACPQEFIPLGERPCAAWRRRGRPSASPMRRKRRGAASRSVS